MTMVSKVSSEILALSKQGKLLVLSVLIDSLSSSRIRQLLSLSILINSSQTSHPMHVDNCRQCNQMYQWIYG